ncbi:MAG: FixH family protein [Betaproteobacteria bacterium]|nr:FixH family protein [Betaproteobacteria bacterium]
MAVDSQTLDNQPWYKQGWPWFLFGLPAVSVVVGISLFVIANTWNVDSLVTDDYYKEGKGVTILVDRQMHAQNLGMSAQATLREGSISIKLSAAQEKDLPAVLHLAIVHPTQDRFDQHILLQREGDGVYSGPVRPLEATRWLFQLEDESRAWRMTGNASVPTETEVSIEPFQSGSINQAKSIRPSDS